MSDFRSWLLEDGLTTEEEIEALTEPDNAEMAQRYLHAEIFNSVFGIEARYQVLANGDSQVRKALEVLHQARELLARRRALDGQPDVPELDAVGL